MTGTARPELLAAMDSFLGALASRAPNRTSLAENARYTENGQQLEIGDGAWATVDAVGRYRHVIADPVSGNVAAFATVTEGQTRSILVARLRLMEGRVTEIETMIARPNLMASETPFANGPDRLDDMGQPHAGWAQPVPAEARMDRAALRRIANMYFAGLEKNDGKGDYPFADDCARVENGFATTVQADAGQGRDPDTPYALDFKTMTARQQFETGFFAFVDRIRHRRFPVIDEERGLVFAFAFFDHSGTVRDYRLADGTAITGSVDRPFTWQIGEAFRIEQGLITRIEAVMTACPYGMPPGWPMLEGDIL